jgi:hypothetical protein
MGLFDIFRRKPDGPVWTVTLDDVRDVGMHNGMHAYEVTWRKGPQTITSTYAFPTPKPLAKVLRLAQAEC